MSNIEITNIEAFKENMFEAKITNTEEAYIEAHNISTEAHANLIKPLEEAFETLKSIEENMVKSEDIPTKISELENDSNYVSEESLVNSLELRELVNKETLEKKLEDLNEELTTSVSNLDVKVTNNWTNFNTNKANIDADNFSQDGRENLTKLSIPNWAANSVEISHNTIFTAPYDGFVSGWTYSSGGPSYIYIYNSDGSLANVLFRGWSATSDIMLPIEIKLEKGMSIKIVASHNVFCLDNQKQEIAGKAQFIPLKGANIS